MLLSWHIILITSQSAFSLTPYCSELSLEATNTNLIVFGLTRQNLEITIYRTWLLSYGEYVYQLKIEIN